MIPSRLRERDESGGRRSNRALMTPPTNRRRWARFAAGTLGITAVVVLAALAYWHFWLRWPTGTGPAGPPVDRTAFARMWSSREVFLVGMGDSITAGFGARPGHSYFERLVRNPPEEFGELQGVCLSRVLPKLRVTNLAVNGSTSLHHVRSQLPKLQRHTTNVLGLVLLTTGGNDLIHNYGRTPPVEGAMYGATLAAARPWIENFRLRLDGMVATITNAFPGGCHVFLANIYDPTDGVGDIHRARLPRWPEGMEIHAAYNQVIAECAARHSRVHLVDIHAAFLGHGIHCAQFWRPFCQSGDPHYWYHANLEDPNERGYDALRRLFLNEIARVLQPAAVE
jgi:lysophospholipase L1-like esterase